MQSITEIAIVLLLHFHHPLGLFLQRHQCKAVLESCLPLLLPLAILRRYLRIQTTILLPLKRLLITSRPLPSCNGATRNLACLPTAPMHPTLLLHLDLATEVMFMLLYSKPLPVPILVNTHHHL
jgi:hypothetical protein